MATAAPSAGPPAATPLYAIYPCRLGSSLVEALDELINSGHINPQLALQTLNQFDKSAAEALQKEVKAKATVKAHLSTYRLCDEVWTFILEKPTFKLENNGETVNAPGKVRVVACKAADAPPK
ncbi:hypothetical protein JCM11641_000948 [Rhodosporidiobolus odoratus]